MWPGLETPKADALLERGGGMASNSQREVAGWRGSRLGSGWSISRL